MRLVKGKIRGMLLTFGSGISLKSFEFFEVLFRTMGAILNAIFPTLDKLQTHWLINSDNDTFFSHTVTRGLFYQTSCVGSRRNGTSTRHDCVK